MPLPMYQKGSDAMKKDRPKNIIAIAAGKGGVGKSSVTTYLAHALRQEGHSVGILDADIYGPSIRQMLPEDKLPGKKGDKLVPAVSRGICTLSMAYFRKENEAAAVRAPIANSVITQFIEGVEWGPLDYLMIDFPPGTGDIQLTLAQKAHLSGALMVTTPQNVALLDVRKALNLFHQVNVPVLGIIENMSYYYHEKTDEKIAIFGEGGGKRLASECNLPYFGQIPIDPALCESGDRGSPLPDGRTAEVFLTLANLLDKQVQHLRTKRAGALSSFQLNWKEMPPQ